MAKSNDTNTRTVTLAQAAERIRLLAELKLPVFLWGGAGIGKSDMVHQIARSLGGVSVDVRMGNMQPTDLMGIPYYNKAKNNMSWAHPAALPTEEFCAQYKFVTLFLDELNTAPPATQAAAYQLVLDRTVGEYKLPDNVIIIGAGNRENDSGVTYKMPAPLRNRMVHLEVKPDYESWFDWATTIGNQHPDVVAFLSFKKEALSDFDPKSSSRAFATPRSWSFVSKIMFAAKNAGDDVITDLVAGSVGEGLAISFMAYRKVGKNLPRPEQILDGTVTELKTRDMSAQYSILMSLNYELRELWHKDSNLKGADSNGNEKREWKSDKLENEWMKKADRFMTFIMKNFDVELAIMAARISCKQYRLPFQPGKLKSFPEFSKQYGHFIAAAGTGR